MRIIETFNRDWTFRAGFEPAFASASQSGETVQLPHTAVELPYNYFDEKSYQKAFTYQKLIAWDPRFEGREVSLVFDGAMADSVVYLNGIKITAHKDGYTPFEARLTPHLKAGNNLLTVKIDGSENPEIPPFGGVIDYLTYAGIYRDVWLKVTAPVSIKNVKIETPDVLAETKQVTAKVWISNPTDQALSGKVTAVLKDGAGQEIARTETTVSGAEVSLGFSGLQGITLWDIDNPALYRLTVMLETAAGTDETTSRFGFRSAEYTIEGFKLNGRVVKLRGLNRHQAWPHLGYAMGRRGQEKDADILKYDLACNIARTSHYPQSKYFLDRCDEIGLLVFEEIPGWQHIGGAMPGRRRAFENVRRMIRARLEPSLDHHLGRAHQRERRMPMTSMSRRMRMARSLDTTPPERRRALHHRERAARRRLHNERLHSRQWRKCRGDNRERTGAARAARGDRARPQGALHDHRIWRSHVSDQTLSTRNSGRLNMLAAPSGDPQCCMRGDPSDHQAPPAGACSTTTPTRISAPATVICYHGVTDMYPGAEIRRLTAYASPGRSNRMAWCLTAGQLLGAW